MMDVTCDVHVVYAHVLSILPENKSLEAACVWSSCAVPTSGSKNTISNKHLTLSCVLNTAVVRLWTTCQAESGHMAYGRTVGRHQPTLAKSLLTAKSRPMSTNQRKKSGLLNNRRGTTERMRHRRTRLCALSQLVSQRPQALSA